MDAPTIILWVCTAVFIVAAAITVLALVGKVRLGGASIEDHRYYLKRLFSTLIVAVVGIAVGVFGRVLEAAVPAPPNVVPQPTTHQQQTLPPESDAGFELLRDVSVWDLRGWKPVPAGHEQERISPAHYINYLHVKRHEPRGTYIIHYATEEGAAIDLRCITHSAKIYEQQVTDFHKDGHQYAVEVDVSSVPLDQEFLVVIEGTYWNGFRRDSEDASTYTTADITPLGELAVIVLFPDDRHFKSVSTWEAESRAGATEHQYRLPSSLYRDSSGQFVYWDVTTRQPNMHYKLSWTW